MINNSTMKLIVLSNPTNLNNEHRLLCSLFEAGLTYFHLRKPNFILQEMEAYIQQIPSTYWSKIVLHSHHSLVEKYNLKGKHLSLADSADKRRNNNSTSANISKISVKQTNTNESINYTSTSFHSLEKIKQNSINYEYVFLSPIFDSISKQGYKSAFDKATLKTLLNELNKNVEIIALGGIDEHNIPQAVDLGFDGVALLGALWQAEYPIEKFKQLAAVCNSVNTIKKEVNV